MAWCSCASKISDFNVDVQSFNALTLDMSDDFMAKSVVPGAKKTRSPVTPIPLAKDDDYDPRKPEFVIQASPEEAGAKSADIVKQQISHLKSMIARRKDQADRTPNSIIDHYEKVLGELGHVLESGEQGDKGLSPMTSPKARTRLFADVSDETSLAQELSFPQLPPSPARSECVGPSQTGTPDGATPLPMKLSPSTPCQPVSPITDQLPDDVHHSLGISSRCDSLSITSEDPLDGGIHLPHECRRTLLFPSPRSQGMETKKPYLDSDVSRDDCAGSNFNFSFLPADMGRLLGSHVRIGTLLDDIQDHIQNLTFARLPFVDYFAETTSSGLLHGTSSESTHVMI